MRATASFRIFTQQYGRLMRAFDIRKLLIIDVVGNFRNLHYFGELYDENNDKSTVDKPELEGSFKVGFADFEVSNILAEIEAYHNQHLAWDKCFIIAKAFYIEHGHLVVPKDYRVGGFSLYQWVNEQRKYRYCHSRRRLEEWQIKLLDEIGMDWDPANGTWLEEYEVVKEYALENDIANISSNNSPNYGLNIPKWIKKQKADFRNGLLSERQIKLLSDIGIELEQECLSDWKSNFSKLEAYVLEHGGIDNLNKDFPLLYRWLRRQIAIACGEEKGRISEKQIRKIEDLGISIYTKRSILERQLEDLRSFTVRYKRLPTEKEKDYYQIRLALEKKLSDGKLSQIQENILINMGMKKKQKKKRKNFSWKEKCDAFESFISEFPHKQISRGTIWNDIPLGEILHHMKKKKQNGELSEAELELLERIQR